MQKYKVLWSDVAKLDLYRIIEFIAVDNPKNAFSILERLERKATTLEYNPKRGRYCPELLDVGIKTYRELISKPWRIVYRMENSTVYIIGVFDSRRNLEEIFKTRLSINN